MNTIHVEGYWWCKTTPQYPNPIHNSEPFAGKETILKKLKSIQSKALLKKSKGWSTCRCCGISNGTEEYHYKDWRWPSGLIHYIEVHNIRPTDLFIENVLRLKIEKNLDC